MHHQKTERADVYLYIRVSRLRRRRYRVRAPSRIHIGRRQELAIHT